MLGSLLIALALAASPTPSASNISWIIRCATRRVSSLVGGTTPARRRSDRSGYCRITRVEGSTAMTPILSTADPPRSAGPVTIPPAVEHGRWTWPAATRGGIDIEPDHVHRGHCLGVVRTEKGRR